jgi:hypothetical protein
MSKNNATQRLLRYLGERLELLHEALADLGRRLREHIAQAVGGHLGEAVRDAVRAALDRCLPGPDPGGQRYHEPWPGRQGQGLPYHQSNYEHHRYQRSPVQEYGYEEEHEHFHQQPQAARAARPGGPPPYWSVLPAALQLAGWCLRRLRGRHRAFGLAAVGAAAGVTAVVAGPLAGAVAAAAGTALLLTSLADAARDAVGGLIEDPER